MTEVTLTRDDLASLGQRLDEVAGSFDERERFMLLAVLALAGEALQARAGEEADVSGFGASVPSVSEIVVTKTMDSSSPNLFQAACGGAGSGDPHLSESVSLNFTKIIFS
jgi:type VI protein secretion system component Hcp